MNQKQIGNFLKELRKEKGITQEQLAEKLNVSNRTVSRWETGNNMPDISLIVEIAELFDVSIPEIINGERKCKMMNDEEKEIANTMTEYAKAQQDIILKRVRIISIVGLISLIISFVMEELQPVNVMPIYGAFKGMLAGFSAGALLTMVLYTTGVLTKMRERKTKSFKIIAIISLIILVLMVVIAAIYTF